MPPLFAAVRCPRSFDDPVGAREHRGRYRQAELTRRIQVYDQLENGRALDRKIGRLCPFENAVNEIGGAPVGFAEFWAVSAQCTAFGESCPSGNHRYAS